jgi:hypothetical protein
MAQIKLLSIKRNEEASYFYESNGSPAFDSNKNEVVEDHAAPQKSKNVRREEERKSKKEQKEKMKELKQREKEKKKSLKSSRKKIVGSVDTGRPSDREETTAKGNGDINVNGGFQVSMDVGEAAKNKNDESLDNHEVGGKEEESKEEHGEIKNEHEDASGLHEDLTKEHEQVSDELSMKTHEHSTREITEQAISSDEPATSSEGHVDPEMKSESVLEKPREVLEEVITADSAETSEEAPREMSQQPRKVNPGIVEPNAGHVEIEISEVSEFEAEPASGSNQVVVTQTLPQTSYYQSNAGIEGPILVATVQEVESGVDLDGIFAECGAPQDEEDKEERRKSVRFQEETEEIGSESEDHEHASMNLGGDFTDSNDDGSARPPRTLEPAVEVVSKEERSEVESCTNLDEVFAASERKANATETVSEESRVVVTKVNGSANVNGRTKVGNGGTNVDDLVEINLNESNEHRNTAAKKKEKRKRGGLYRCCFP